MKTETAKHLLAICLLAPAMTSSALQFGDFTYEVNSPATNTVTITGYTGVAGDVVIPSTIDSKDVTHIGDDAFRNRDGMTSVTIGSGVTSIGDEAFYGCDGLTGIIIPDNVTTIGTGAFRYCASLTAITVDAGNVTYSSVNGVLFDKGQTIIIQHPGGKTGSYIVPGSVTTIGDLAFSHCDGLTSVTIPSSVTTIGYAAFSYCTGLTSVTIPSSVTTIGGSAFNSCSSLTSISVNAANAVYSSVNGVLFDKTGTTLVAYPGGRTGSYGIPDSVTTIGSAAFSGGKLVGITIGDSVTIIGNYAFIYCTSLADVTIGDNVTRIGYAAFYECTSLTSITIGDGVNTIHFGAFVRCYSLTSISVNAVNAAYSSVNGVLFDKTGTTLVAYPGGRIGSYEIPDSVTTIGYQAFCFCTSLTSATIPDSVTTIGNYAFQYCSDLASVYCQGNAPILGSSVFSGASNATVYYTLGKTGWGAIYGGRPAVLWNPLIQTGDGSFGVQAGAFGFNITESESGMVVVEACTNLTDGPWVPMETNSMNNSTVYFSDADWTNHNGRFYRLSMP